MQYAGNIDAAVAVASLRSGELPTCRPRFIDRSKYLKLRNVYHPLIPNGTKNDLTIDGKGILITGSNMSGKTTFLRTVMINSILAQTISTCFAEEFVTPFVVPYSSIRIDDNLAEGESYFLAEVNTIGVLVREADSGGQHIFVLDEVFKGTNTQERIAAAKAVLSFLNKNNNIVIVSTHDLELSEMLKNEFDLYHFSEQISDSKLSFDHRLKHGPLTTRNAIRILEIMNYPESIINEANELSRQQPSK